MSAPPLTLDKPLDKEALRAKYKAERDKRLRAEGIGQYVRLEGHLAVTAEDPYTPRAERDAKTDHVTFAFIGGGFAGLVAGARLVEAGIKDVRIIEKGGDFGGTWYWNRYPGAMCDVESYCYLPLLEELGYIPKHKYSFAPEILEHSRRIARHYRLYDDALLQTNVTELKWDDERSRWIVTTSRGDRFTTQFIAMANGPLSRPKLPGIPGINEFAGHTFHTSRWDYGYTGGDSNGNLTKLKDKRVGIIGTGATAVQCVPHLGEWSKALYVFQRTPSSIDVRNNCETDPAWAASLEPGWQRHRQDNFNTLVSGGDQEVDLVKDGWTDIFRLLTGTAAKEASRKIGRRLTTIERAQLMEMHDYAKMNTIRSRVDDIVKDPVTAAALKPWYRQFCKRPCFHDEYLQTFNLPNVTLVDTDGKGVERLTHDAVVANGREYEVDCLIFATGFEVGTSYTRRAGYDIIGRGGVTLSEHWRDGLRTLHGLTTDGFPNCFFLGFTQGAVTISVPQALGEQARHVTYIVNEARARQANVIEPSAEAVGAYVDEVRSLARLGTRFYTECTPGYYNSEGARGNRSGFFSDMYGAGPIRFFELLNEWRSAGNLEGLALR